MQIARERGFEVAYDAEVQAVAVTWRPPPYALTRELDDARNVDYGPDGAPVSAEFLSVDDGVDLRGVPRAAEFAPLLERLGIRITHRPEEAAPRPPLAAAVADAVVSYRARHGLSLRGLARRLGMPHPQVVRLERGEVAPRLETVERVAGALGVRFLLLVTPTGAPEVRLPAGFAVVDRADAENGSRVVVAAG